MTLNDLERAGNVVLWRDLLEAWLLKKGLCDHHSLNCMSKSHLKSSLNNTPWCRHATAADMLQVLLARQQSFRGVSHFSGWPNSANAGAYIGRDVGLRMLVGLRVIVFRLLHQYVHE